MDPARLFVYGTLRRGCVHKFARLLHSGAQFDGMARMRGRLYRLGWYPGAVASLIDGEWIRGELYSLGDGRWLLDALDTYEDFSFDRVRAEVERDGGECVEAWVYLYRGTTPAMARIRSGDWLRG